MSLLDRNLLIGLLTAGLVYPNEYNKHVKRKSIIKYFQWNQSKVINFTFKSYIQYWHNIHDNLLISNYLVLISIANNFLEQKCP